MKDLHKVLSAFALMFIFFTAPLGAQCPSDIVIDLKAGECDAIVTYAVSDPACASPATLTHVSGPLSGSVYPAGVYTVVVDVDCEGTVTPCSFDVTINAFPDPIGSITCNDKVNISLDEDCSILVSADMFLEGGPYGCYLSDYSVFFSSDPNLNVNGSVMLLPIGDYNVTVQDNATGNYCWGEFVVEDKIAPVLECLPLEISCIEASCGIPNMIAPGVSVADYLAAQSACGAVTLTSSSDVEIPGECDGDLIYRTWIATDAFGNTASCIQEVSISPADLSTVTGSAGEIYSNNPYANTFDDPILPGEIRLPARLVSKFSCGDDLTPQAIYDQCSVYERDPLSTACASYAGEIAQHNLAVKAAFPHVVKKIPHRVGNTNCGVDLDYYVPITNDLCNIFFSYTDQELLVCDDCPGNGNKKVIRTWKVLDWCNATTVDHVQILKAVDAEGPTFVGFQESITVSANPWGCAATFVLPIPNLHDNCDYETSYSVSSLTPGVTFTGNIASNFPKSMDPQYLYYTATDCCGNETVFQMEVLVVDRTPPVVISKENVVASISSNPTLAGDDVGLAKVFVGSIDNGSHDGDCGPVRLAVRRTSDAPACDNFGAGTTPHNNNTTYFNFSNLSNSLQPANHDRDDTDEGQYIKFCCADLTELDTITGTAYGIHEVWLGAWDDANMNGIPGDVVDGVWDNFNESWANVRVENKLPAQLVPPADAWLECHINPNDPGVLDQIGRATAIDLCVEANVSYTDVCGADLDGNGRVEDKIVEFEGHLVNETFNKTCNYGPILRTWCVDGTNVCASQIIVLYHSGLYFDGCEDDLSTKYSIIWPYEGSNDNTFDANGTAVAYENDYATCLATGGYAGYAEVQKDCIDDFDTEVIWSSAYCTLLGHSIDSTVFHFEEGACQKIIFEHTVIDWCQYDPNDPLTGGIWTWTVIGKMIDTTAPELNCEDECIQVQPACSTTATLSAVSDDSASPCPSEWISWAIFVDLWGDGTYDYEFSSFVPEDNSSFLWDDDNFNGIPDLRLGNSAGGDADNLPSGRNKTTSGEVLQITIPEEIEGSKNNHRIQWNAYDGCGNVTTKTVTFQVLDKKAPTPYCVDISTALMDNGTVELWACDFDRGSFDNCTASDRLRFSFGENDIPDSSNPRYDENTRCTSRTFTCDDYTNSENGFVKVTMAVWDECGNYDYCLVNLRLVDNLGGCGEIGSKAYISGNVSTEDGKNIPDANVKISSIAPQYPDDMMSDLQGMYAFSDNPMYIDYDVTTEKNDDYLNGVSTLDLVLIQRHILGVQSLNSGHKVVAADINNDETISAIDLIELRKLILGIYSELPNNDSWRFLDGSQILDVVSPWPLDEMITISALDKDMMTEDFVGIKVGDVNGNVTLLNNNNTVDSRSNETITLDIADQNFVSSEVFEIPVYAENFNDVSGFQFTMTTSNLELQDVRSGAIQMSIDNFGIHGNQITTSWISDAAISVTEEALFYLTFEATQNGSTMNSFNLNSEITNAEAYVGGNYEQANIELRNGMEDSSFELYQNEPNPFNDFTLIGFNLPEASNATLTVLDVTGKVIKSIQADFDKGFNQIEIKNTDLRSGSGVFYYQLENGNQMVTKKMIVIE